MRPRVATLLVCCWLIALVAVEWAPTQSTIPFTVGFADDLPKEIGTQATDPARSLGATALRLTTQWSLGQTQLDATEATRLDRALAAAVGLRVFLAVYGTAGTAAPRDSASREAYCGFVRDVLLRYSAIRDIVVWNEPNERLFWNPQVATDGTSLAPEEYEALLARCYDVLHGAVPGVRVLGLALSSTGNDDAGSHSPGAFIRKVGDAYRASGRAAPLLDAVAFHPYPVTGDERPWTKHIGSTTIGEGDWNKLMTNLSRAFVATGQPLPGECNGSVCPMIWYLESGFQTLVDPAKAAAYSGTETVARLLPPDVGGEPNTPPPAGSPAPDQRTQILDATRLAACQPYVAGILNFLLADEPILAGWQSGVLWADLSAKPSAGAFSAAFAAASSGSVDCDALKGGRPSSDYTPPPAPTALVASPAEAPFRVDLHWNGVSDSSAPVTYRVSRNGAFVATTSVLSWTDTTVARNTSYRYVVRALDAAGNLGDASAPADATTPAAAAPSPPAAPNPPPTFGGEGGPPANLSVSLETLPRDPSPGQDIEIRLRVSNAAGTQSATNVLAAIALPSDATLLGPPLVERGPGCSGTPLVACPLDFLPPGSETPIRFSVDVGGPGEKQIRVDISASNESDPTDNTAALTLSVRAPNAATHIDSRSGMARTGLTLTGTRRADRIVGSDRADLLRGGAGDDRLLGRGGNDILVGGEGHDTIEGNAGNDRIVVRDGARDTVRCGSGRDTVVADPQDLIALDCEARQRA